MWRPFPNYSDDSHRIVRSLCLGDSRYHPDKFVLKHIADQLTATCGPLPTANKMYVLVSSSKGFKDTFLMQQSNTELRLTLYDQDKTLLRQFNF